MSVASAQVEPRELPKPPVRIRTLLLVALVFGTGYWLYPRAIAAWTLHSRATALADYALCMVGPTGPSLLRDNPSEFRVLVRRRLISTPAAERPFSDCAKAARELTGSSEVEQAHRTPAWSFVEYGGAAADRAAAGGRNEASLDDLRVTTRPLALMAKEAWPFIRGGYTRLVRPSLGAHEAVHPVELPRPNVGRGLPAWRAWYRSVQKSESGPLMLAVGVGANLSVYKSADGGINWSPAPLSGAAGFAGRCSEGEHTYTFALDDDGKTVMVGFEGPDGPPSHTPLAKAQAQIVGVGCDDRAVAAALKVESSPEVALRICKFRSGCRTVPLPTFGGPTARPRFPLDVARLDGVTIVAVPMHDVVRVTSSRDDGRTWTPYSVAFDRAAHSEVRVDVPIPDRLLVVGQRVLLYGGAPKPSQTYSLLFSDDAGASWRTE